MTKAERFDFAVVGAGAAVCVVAARLAESGPRSVLLLEAGPDLRGQMPAGMRNGWDILPGEFDWGYTSQLDEAIGVLNLRRSKVVGGTSWLTRFTPRGAPADYDAWAAAGNQGWSWDDVLPYFIRLESDLDFGADAWHGANGPMPSNRYLDRRHSQVVSTAVEALIASGFPEVADHNRPGAVGVGRMSMSAREGVRVTTADAYLSPKVTPPNLTVRGHAQVDAVTFDGTRATGVQMLDGSRIEAGWVVLCAGTYGSPSILMRSGIGPAEDLSRAYELMDRPDIQRFCGSGSLERAPSSGREAKRWIRNHRYSIPHVVGTCAMGIRPDNGAVVDSEGRVHGAERLSVIDASIMPDVPSGFTHFPTIMLAELLSAMLVAFV